MILKREQAWFLLKRNDWPKKTLAYEMSNLAYAIRGLKITFWEAII